MSSANHLGEWQDAEFLRSAFKDLDVAGIPYCVERNHEGYPEQVTGDVDLVIMPSDFQAAVDSICASGSRFGWRMFTKYMGSHSAHVGLYAERFPARFAIVFEFFSGGVWRGICFLPPERVLELRESSGSIWSAHPAHQCLITLIHHLLYNRRVIEKYRDRISRIANEAGALIEEDLSLGFGRSASQEIVQMARFRDWAALEARAGNLRKSLLRRAFLLQPGRVVSGVTRAWLGTRSKPEGVVISIEGLTLDQSWRLAEELIASAVILHLFLPPNREILDSCENGLVKRVEWIIRSGGIAIVVNPECRALPFASLANSIVRLREHDIDHFHVQIGNSAVPVSKELAVRRVWQQILAHRSKGLDS